MKFSSRNPQKIKNFIAKGILNLQLTLNVNICFTRILSHSGIPNNILANEVAKEA